MPAHAQTLTVLHSFTSLPDGLTPIGGVIQDQAGNLYGTTARGGTGTQGTVFKIDTSGHETVLHSFVRRPGGLDPEAGLTIDSSGNPTEQPNSAAPKERERSSRSTPVVTIRCSIVSYAALH